MAYSALNTNLQNVAEIALTQAAISLRKNSIVPRLVSRDIQGEAVQRNKTISVPVYPPATVQEVTVGSENTPAAMSPSTVDIQLREFWEVPFVMDDVEMRELEEKRSITPSLDRAAIALADKVDNWILTQMEGHCFLYRKKAAALIALADVISLRTQLNQESVPKDRRRHVIYNDATGGDLLLLAPYSQTDQAGETTPLHEGLLTRRMGLNQYESGNLPTGWANGTWNTVTVNQAVVPTGYPADPSQSGGTSSIVVSATALTAVAGDRFTFAGDTTQKYVCTTAIPGAVTDATLTFAPKLRQAIADDEVIALVTDIDGDTQGIAFHEMAFAFASRPLADTIAPGAIVATRTDPLSGLSMRLTIVYEARKKQTVWSLDMLYGGAVVYPEMLVRLVPTA